MSRAAGKYLAVPVIQASFSHFLCRGKQTVAGPNLYDKTHIGQPDQPDANVERARARLARAAQDVLLNNKDNATSRVAESASPERQQKRIGALQRVLLHVLDHTTELDDEGKSVVSSINN